MNYTAPSWSEIFKYNQLHTFDDFWQLKLPTIDAGNYGRGGQSLVSRHLLNTPDGKEETVYIKRQQNYNCPSWRHPFIGIPTFEREFINWQRFQQLGLGTYELVYFAKRREGKHQQAILISRELQAIDLVTYLGDASQDKFPVTLFNRLEVTHSIANTIRKMHDSGLLHGHLSPKHVFINGLPGNIQSYIIDMELMRKMPWKQKRTINDLVRFVKRMPTTSLVDRMRFFKHYLGVRKLTVENKRLWRIMAKRAA
ncbi:MAG: lipopolysaccharide kinase InaA family protein [Gammaproteobacteria bacterium]